MQCPRCQHENPAAQKFCGECGTSITGAVPNTRSYTELNDEIESLKNSLSEALEQQTATGEILRVISSSPTDVQPVFDAIASSAARLCGTYDVFIRRLEGDGLRLVAHHGPIPASALVPVGRGLVSGLAVLERRTVHVIDVQAAADELPEAATLGREFGIRTNLGVPLLREGVALGVIVLRRAEASPFSDKEVALLQTFAHQAVIAIENVRLFNETKEALDQQTATGHILSVISRSPTDIQPVLDAVAESAARLCGAVDAIIQRVDGDTMRRVAHFGAITSISDARPVTPDTPSGRAILERRTIHIEDIVESFARREYLETRALQQGSGFRTVLVVPLLREDAVIGIITIRRLEVRPFTMRQMALVKTFADQAVIAIENVRLFEELQEKSRSY